MDQNLRDPSNWGSLYWFRPDVLGSFTYENRWFLYAILGIPLVFILRWALNYRFRERLELAFFVKKEPIDLSAWLRFIPMLVQAMFLALLLLAIARPQRTSQLTEQKSEGIDIFLATDISESMRIEDLKPNRLEAAKRVALAFIQGRNVDRIGLIVFAGDAFPMAPLTTDYQLLEEYIGQTDFGLITKPGTAIGSALAIATNRMADSKSKTKVIILLSDGDNTAGNIDPTTAARLAASYGIKVYTIAVGRDGPVPVGEDVFGSTQYAQNNLDERTLRSIARLGNGQFFRAVSERSLDQIFKQIDRYERSEIRVRRFKQTQDYYTVYLAWSLVLLLIWIFLRNTFMMNALED
jgi:Ca-activated chloride channel homolog